MLYRNAIEILLLGNLLFDYMKLSSSISKKLQDNFTVNRMVVFSLFFIAKLFTYYLRAKWSVVKERHEDPKFYLKTAATLALQHSRYYGNLGKPAWDEVKAIM